MRTQEVTYWKCGNCGVVHEDEEVAERCCGVTNRKFDDLFRWSNNMKGYEKVSHNNLPATLRVRYCDMIDKAYNNGEITKLQAENFTYNGNYDC